MKKRNTLRYRTSPFDTLEDRVVPATVTAAQLAAVGVQINAAYSTFATGVRQAETTLLTPTTTGTTAATTPSVLATVTTEIQTLSTALGTAIDGLSTTPLVGQATAVGLLQSELNGVGNASLLNQVSTLLFAVSDGTSDGLATQSSLPLLFGAVEGAISSSYATTSLQVYLLASGQAATTTTTTITTAFSTTTFGSGVASAYSAFATSTHQYEATLAASSTASTVLASTVSGEILPQIIVLANSLGTPLALAPSTSNTAPIQGQILVNGGPGSLGSVISGLLAAAPLGSSDGTVPASSLSLLYAAVDQAIAVSLTATTVDGYLLATSPAQIQARTATTTTTTA